jgi:integrase
LIVAYWTHCKDGGVGPGDLRSLKLVLKVVKELYVDLDVRQFGPLALRAVRDKIVAEKDWSRRYINKQVSRIRAMFNWGMGRELVRPETVTALTAVEPLMKGKTKAREIKPITTIDDSFIEATMPFLNRHHQAMVRVQQATGCRAGELVKMRWVDINTANPLLWEYRPPTRKTDYAGHDRTT